MFSRIVAMHRAVPASNRVACSRGGSSTQDRDAPFASSQKGRWMAAQKFQGTVWRSESGRVERDVASAGAGKEVVRSSVVR